jgi:Zn-finger domain-containing protein
MVTHEEKAVSGIVIEMSTKGILKQSLLIRIRASIVNLIYHKRYLHHFRIYFITFAATISLLISWLLQKTTNLL